MDNNNNQPPLSQGGSEDEKKTGSTLDLQNISIKTLKDDIAEESGEADKDKSGWFSFLAKHKGSGDKLSNTPASVSQPDGQTLNTDTIASDSTLKAEGSLEPGLSSQKPISRPTNQDSDFLDKELDQFKTEIEKPKVTSDGIQKNISGSVEAPPNLPISEKTLNSLPEEEENTLGDTDLSSRLEAGGNPDSPVASHESEMEERPALGSFFPPKEVEPEEADSPEKSIKNKLTSALSGNVGMTGNEDHQVSRIDPMPKEGIAGSMLGDEEETGQKDENPFSTKMQKKEPEKKSLLQSVESALNYSAPPEFSEEREKVGSGESEDGKVVDLREKPEVKAMGILKNKKMVIILGGVGAFVIILIIILSLVLGGSNSNQNKAVTQANTNSQGNKNQNVNPVAQIKPTTPAPKPVLTPQKILSNTKEIQVGSIDAISQELDKVREGQSVQKQTQLIFLKSDGSSISFQDLINATGINIPQRVLPHPGSVPALIFADFFRGQTIMGMVIPTVDEADLAASKMKNWESTMVLDLDQLWKGVNIDNQGAYFADSQLFKNARFALIDKKSKLSLDYVVEGGYIFIACGKDSMTILKNNFVADSSESNDGIKWEEDSSTTVSGVETSSSNSPNINSNSNTSGNEIGE